MRWSLVGAKEVEEVSSPLLYYMNCELNFVDVLVLLEHSTTAEKTIIFSMVFDSQDHYLAGKAEVVAVVVKVEVWKDRSNHHNAADQAAFKRIKLLVFLSQKLVAHLHVIRAKSVSDENAANVRRTKVKNVACPVM